MYCPDNDRVYLVPVGHVGQREGFLRVEATRNGQTKRVRWAREFEIRPG